LKIETRNLITWESDNRRPDFQISSIQYRESPLKNGIFDQYQVSSIKYQVSSSTIKGGIENDPGISRIC